MRAKVASQNQEILPFLQPPMPFLCASPGSMKRRGRADALTSPTFFEFFAGGGMVRSGLGRRWRCLFANDYDFKKCTAYRNNWGEGELVQKDIAEINVRELPGDPDLVWASFPCQDLSLAGMGAGLRGDRSGTFWPFWNLILKLKAARRAPSVVVLENVCGTLTSHDGKDFAAIVEALSSAKYAFGAMVVDAVSFVPHSRPRLFLVAVAEGIEIPEKLYRRQPCAPWHTRSVQNAYQRLPDSSRSSWYWWNLPIPERRTMKFEHLMERNHSGMLWHSTPETSRLLEMMSPVNVSKITEAKKSGKRLVGTLYKRTRFDSSGRKVQRAEVRFDGVAGCLRTPAGGSSRQTVVVVNGSEVRSRLMTSRETARLMGLPDAYVLPVSYNEAYHLTGDGVVVHVVRFLAEHLLEPLVDASLANRRIAQ